MPEKKSWTSWTTWKPGTAIAIGLSVGVVLGILTEDLAVFLALGVVFGSLGEGAIAKSRD